MGHEAGIVGSTMLSFPSWRIWLLENIYHYLSTTEGELCWIPAANLRLWFIW